MLYQAVQNSIQVLHPGLQHAKIILLRVKLFKPKLELTTQQQTSSPPKGDTSHPLWLALGNGEHPLVPGGRSAKAPHLGHRKLKTVRRE